MEKNSGNVSGSDCLEEKSKLLEAQVSSMLAGEFAQSAYTMCHHFDNKMSLAAMLC